MGRPRSGNAPKARGVSIRDRPVRTMANVPMLPGERQLSIYDSSRRRHTLIDKHRLRRIN